jgi:sialidase-1
MKISIESTGLIDCRNAAFPGSVELKDGSILCSYGVGGGPNPKGGTEFSRSLNGGRTWTPAGTILPATTQPRSANFLKLSSNADRSILYAYGNRYFDNVSSGFGEVRNEAVVCRSLDEGATWSDPMVLPNQHDCPLEASHSILGASDGRLLAPAALLPSRDRLGERVVVWISQDDGLTWPEEATVFRDPEERHGFFEQKLAEIEPGVLLATAWTVTLGDVQDRENSFAISTDNGRTWSEPRSTGIFGQTLTPVPLGGNMLLVLYNRRYGEQAIVMLLVRLAPDNWTVEWEGTLYDAKSRRHRPAAATDGVKEFDEFAFGFPTAIPLQDGTIFATHWCKEEGAYCIRWTRLRLDS